MRGAWVIAKREVVSFFLSPLAYVVLSAWVLLMGMYFWLLCFFAAQQPFGSGSTMDGPMQQFFGGTTLFYFVVLIFVPLLTMRLLAEEARQGTIEPLLTAPVNETSVVLGKLGAALTFWAAMWLPTLMYFWLTSRYGDVDLGAMGATYLGVMLLGYSWMAIGLLMSALARNQIVAALLTFATLFVLFMIGLLQFIMTEDDYRGVFELVSAWSHLQAYTRGVVDTRFVAFDVITGSAATFLAVRVLESRRYEG